MCDMVSITILEGLRKKDDKLQHFNYIAEITIESNCVYEQGHSNLKHGRNYAQID